MSDEEEEMTVRELIKELQRLDPSSDILFNVRTWDEKEEYECEFIEVNKDKVFAWMSLKAFRRW